MGISRDSRHKRRLSGGRMPIHKKKRAFEKGRPAANTKLSDNVRVRRIRVRGGNFKYRALRLKEGNFSWASENVTSKTRILDVVYNASNNELIRTKTLVKNCIVLIDAAPFKKWFESHYGLPIGKQKKDKKEDVKKSNSLRRKLEERQKERVKDAKFEGQFDQGRLMACITSRPGQCGRADGYLLEGKELEFYQKKADQKRK